MKEHVLRFIGAVFLTILALLGISAAIRILVTLPLGEKGAEWVGAIGTVGTLIGTIWLATAETRRRKRQERVLARLHGAGIALRISHARAMVNEVHTMLRLTKPVDRTAGFFRECDDKLESIDLWEIAELIPLVPLPFNVAVKMAEAADQIQTARMMFAHLRKGRIWQVNAVNLTTDTLRNMLDRTTQFLDESLRECRLGAAELHLNVD